MNRENRELLSTLTKDRLKQAISDPADETAFKHAMEATSKEIELDNVDREEKANKKAVITEAAKVVIPIFVTALTIGLNYVCKSKYAARLYGMERGDEGVIFTGLAAKGLSDMNEFSKK